MRRPSKRPVQAKRMLNNRQYSRKPRVDKRLSRKPANKVAEKNYWDKKIAFRKQLEAELELLRIFDNDEDAERLNESGKGSSKSLK